MWEVKSFSFTVKGEPFGKLNQRPTMKCGFASLYQPKENEVYMNKVICAIETTLPKSYEGQLFGKEPVEVKIDAYFKIPQECYHYYKKEGVTRLNGKGQRMVEGKKLPTKKPDCDNISKIICDGITHQHYIWNDDNQVARLIVSKFYSEEPRVVVTISKIELNDTI